MSVETDLREELISEIDQLGKVEFGGEKHKVGVQCVGQLADRLIELSKLDQEERKIDIEERKIDIEERKLDVEQQRLADDFVDKRSRNRISVLNIGITAGIAIVGGIAMFVYEERGSITSQAGRKIIDKYIFRTIK